MAVNFVHLITYSNFRLQMIIILIFVNQMDGVSESSDELGALVAAHRPKCLAPVFRQARQAKHLGCGRGKFQF
jgi:hypothetical protein